MTDPRGASAPSALAHGADTSPGVLPDRVHIIDQVDATTGTWRRRGSRTLSAEEDDGPVEPRGRWHRAHGPWRRRSRPASPGGAETGATRVGAAHARLAPAVARQLLDHRAGALAGRRPRIAHGGGDGPVSGLRSGRLAAGAIPR